MESNFNNKDFEQFVKQNADQYRMFPSEKVWNGIHNTLHTRRRWYGIGLTLLLVSTAVVTWVMLSIPSDKKQITGVPSVQKSSTGQTQLITSASIITPGKPASNLFLANVSNKPLINDKNGEALSSSILQNELIPQAIVAIIDRSPSLPESGPIYHAETLNNQSHPDVVLKPADRPENLLEGVELFKDKGEITVSYKLQPEKDINLINYETTVNTYNVISKRNKLIWQIFFLPTVSYRKLIENKYFLIATQQISATSPVNSPVNNDINNVVTHKPDIGLELGFNVGYPLTRRLKVTGGLQMNISKYDIKAYPYIREEARIALSNNNGSTSISNIQTNYRNFQTFTKADWLSNFYISASLPIGLEASLTDPRKTYIGVGGTIQPTYILGNRAYLLSTDFKNYAKVPSLTREWNLSSSFEVFAGYSTGKLNWKVGPQVRYQMLSSFQKKYPVKEHLIDFGLKVGVMFK